MEEDEMERELQAALTRARRSRLKKNTKVTRDLATVVEETAKRVKREPEGESINLSIY